MAPGVYVNWIDAGTSPAGISTSIGGGAFHANRGSLDPTSQTSFDTFTDEYGTIDYTQSYGGDTFKAFFRTAQAAVCVRSPGEGAVYAAFQLANNYLITTEGVNAPSGLVYDGSYVMPLQGTSVDYTQINRDSWDVIFSGQVPANASISFDINGLTNDGSALTVSLTNTFTDHYSFLKGLVAAINTTLGMATSADPTGSFAKVVPRNGFDYCDLTNPASIPMAVRIIGPQNIEMAINTVQLTGAQSLTTVARETEWLAYGVAQNPGAWGNNIACQFTQLNTNRAASVQLLFSGKCNALNKFSAVINGVSINVDAATNNNLLLTDIATEIMASVANVTATVVQVQGNNANRQIVLTANSAVWQGSMFDINVSSANVLAYTATATVTISNSSPAVVTWADHNLVAGDKVVFTGGTLPTGLTAGTTYYVSSTGLAAGAFEVAATLTDAMAGTNSIATTGAGSGTITGTATEGATPPSVLLTRLITPYVSPTNFALNIYEYPDLRTIKVSLSSTLQTVVSPNGNQTNFAYQVNAGPQATNNLRVYVNPLAVTNNWTVQSTTSVNFATGSGFMGGGVDGALSTSADIINAWDLLSDPTQWTVRILLNCGYTTIPVQQAMMELCEARRDCYAILDMDAASQNNDTTTIAARNALNVNSMYGGIYTPDILIYDTDLNLTRYSPPSGYVGAVFALTDQARAVWWSPAGLNRGMIPEAEDLRFAYDNGMVSNMYEYQINPIINYQKEMIVVWGDWTLYFDTSPLQYCGTARMCIIIELEAKQTVAFSLFEPNNQLTRNGVVNNLNEICQEIEDGEGLNNFAVVDLTQTYHIDARQAYFRIILDPTTSIHQIIIDGIITKNGASFTQYESINYLTTAGSGTNVQVTAVG
jgi:hypothetical protein